MKLNVDYPYLCKDRDRHGNVRFYFRRAGVRKIRLRATPGTADFQAAYEVAKAQVLVQRPKRQTTSEIKPGSLRWLCIRYFSSSDFRQLDTSTQTVRRRVLEQICLESVAPGMSETYADFPVHRMTAKAVRVLRDRKQGLPEAANVRIKAIRRLFAWALEEDMPGVMTNPARDVKYMRGRQGGHHSWTTQEVAQYEDRHPVGSTARLALALLLYTGQRRSDVVRFGRQHIRNGWLHFTQQKNRNRRPVTLELPVLTVLRNILDASDTGELTFLVNEWGRPFTANGFGNKMRGWCDQANLAHCTAHGLRKAGAAIAAENGATPHELMSIFGWLTLKEAERYTRAAAQKKLAGRAMAMLERRGGRN